MEYVERLDRGSSKSTCVQNKMHLHEQMIKYAHLLVIASIYTTELNCFSQSFGNVASCKYALR